jgi:hypothetical protein
MDLTCLLGDCTSFGKVLLLWCLKVNDETLPILFLKNKHPLKKGKENNKKK